MSPDHWTAVTIFLIYVIVLFHEAYTDRADR